MLNGGTLRPMSISGPTAFDAPELHEHNGLFAVIDRSPFAPALADPADVLEFEGVQHPFAFAAWDERSKRLWLARDFVGQKPLHYCRLQGGGVAFATEYKALLALSQVKAEPDLDSLQYMQCYKRTPSGRTLLSGIQSAPPGALIRLDRSGSFCDSRSMPPLRGGCAADR